MKMNLLTGGDSESRQYKLNSPNPKHGPRYEGWYAAVKLANQIQVPHLLFTIDKHNEKREHIGLTAIEKLSPEGLFYIDNIKPNNKVVEGMENIVNAVNEKLSKSKPPELIKP